MPINIKRLKEAKRKSKLSYDDLAEKTGYSRSTITNIFCGYVEYPRLDTVRAIEKALGLTPEWTEEEMSQGVGNHAIVLSQKEKDRLRILADGENAFGEECIDMYMRALELLIRQKLAK